MTRDGSWSVISEPGAPFGVLERSVRNGAVRRISVRHVLAAGERLTRLDAGGVDAILGLEEPNPVPAKDRWRGTNR